MDSTLSVSKGCFVFKNGATRAHKPSKKLAERLQRLESNSLLGEQFIHKPSYRLYERTWKKFLQNVDKLQRNSYFRTLENLVTYVTSNNCSTPLRSFGVDEILPAAALLTGINQPDHLEQFEALSQRIKERTDASVCILQSRDCPTIKAAIETMVYNFVEAPYSDDEERSRKRLRRSQCTMKQLHQWYTNNYGTGGRDAVSVESSDAIAPHIRRHILVVILPDFECFGTLVLQDIVLILSSYFARLPFVLIMGVATAVSAVHSTLPYHVMSKLKLRVFQTQTAAIILNEIIDKALLSLEMHFHLSGKTLKFLTHIFLYYDFSINGFIQGFKYCLVEHLLQGKSYALCDNYANNLSLVRSLTHDDLETIRSLPSFRSYAAGISDTQSTTSTLMDDNYLKQQLPQLLRNCHEYFILFRVFLEFLVALVADLPKCPLGKQRYELYSVCMSKEVTAQTEFKECWQILRLMCKDEFVAKFNSAILAAKDLAKIKDSLHYETDRKIFNVVDQKLSQVDELIKKVISAGTDMQRQQQEVTSTKSEELKSRTRQELKEKLLQMSKVKKHTSEFGQSVNKTLGYVLEEIISKHLRPLSAAPLLHELFVFSDISKVLRNILGAPRAALHMALNNPQFYIQCECCNLSNTSQLLKTLPDLSVAYKLHMECGRMINLFDWLQAFNSVLNTEENDQEQIDPQIQARFTRAVAELQFLGYIKMSKRKTDHATRLTW